MSPVNTTSFPSGRRAPVRGAVRATGALAVVGALLWVPGPASAAVEPGEGVPTGVVRVGGQDVPILGSFYLREGWYPRRAEVVGYVHGVRRVEGGTALYYSIGSALEDEYPYFLDVMAFPPSSTPYQSSHPVDIGLVDLASSTMITPLWDEDTTFSTYGGDLRSDGGTLIVGWALFPELPASTTSVQVLMTSGTIVPDVPVEDGALEPVSDEPAPELGTGWPAVPQGVALAATDPAAVTWTLLNRSGDLQAVAQAEESPEQVAVTLDANVLFPSGSAELTPEAQTTLATLAADIASRGTGDVAVTGHTDSDGSNDFNQTLSEQRAGAVRGALEPASGGAVSFASSGRGEDEPLAENSSDEGKQANRRVTVVFQVTGGAR